MSALYPEDVYGVSDELSGAEVDRLEALRELLDAHAKPLLADHWERGVFPSELVAPLANLDLMAERGGLFEGFRNYELARTDVSLATFYNAQSGLFRTTVNLGGSSDQVAAWDPLVRSWQMVGVFCLTEPDHGSDIAGGLATTARRDGESWVLDGAKRWIGGAASATHLAIFARDVADGHVKAFIVPSDAAGVSITTIGRKASLRIMQNSDIVLSQVRVDDEWRLKAIDSFADVAKLLRAMRSDVAWIATGAQAGAYAAAVQYVAEREQFGRPIASFQLVQEKLARMLANLTASMGIVAQLTRQQDRGIYRDENSALAKMATSLYVRETTALAREVVGGNGILIDYDVARFHADAEAIYSYEGTHEITALIVGRFITGLSAFTPPRQRGPA